MITDLKPYPQYKDSGLPWLETIPANWNTARTKTRFRLSIEKSGKAHGKELLSIYTHIGVRPRKDLEARGNKATSTDGYWVVRKGDIIVNKLLAWMGAVGVSHFDGVTSPAYDILRPIQSLEPDYYHHLFRTNLFLQLFKARSRGIMEMRLRLYFDELGQIPILCPPLAEQAAIVRFLDHANLKIERAIRAKRKELALIAEIIVSMAQMAFDPNGARLERLSTVAELVSRPIDRRTGRSYTPIGLYNRGRGLFHKFQRDSSELGDSEFFIVEDGDLVISGQFAWEGAVALAKTEDSGCVASHRFPILRGRKTFVSSAALFAFFRTPYGLMLLDHHSRGAAGRNRPLNIRTLLKEEVAIPNLAAQLKIEELVEKECQIGYSLSKLIRYISEFQKTLTAAVVTGKLDVREAAAQLPAEAEESVPADEELPIDVDAIEEEAIT